jgi:thymidylate synthase
MSLGDVHLYKTHVAQTREQLTRPPLPFPSLRVADKVKNAPWERIEADDFEMVGYMHHPTIRADMAV